MKKTLAMLSATALLLLSVGSAHASSLVEIDYDVKGPGVVFDTIDAAVVDALAYSHVSAHESGNRWLMRGGTIEKVEGGFTYGEPVVASRFDRSHVKIGLGSTDVAHFKTYPRSVGSHRTNLLNETHSDEDRANVDKVDPYHRPSYILTPSLKVKAYRGKVAAAVEDVEIASLVTPSDTLVADHSSR